MGDLSPPFLITASSRGGRPPVGTSSAQAGRHTLDLPDRSAMARLTGGVRQMELGVEKQFRRWCESGVWDLLLQALADGGGTLDMLQMIESTIVRAHRCAAGESDRGAKSGNSSVVRAVGSAPRSMCVATPQVSPSGSYSARAKPMT